MKTPRSVGATVKPRAVSETLLRQPPSVPLNLGKIDLALDAACHQSWEKKALQSCAGRIVHR
jgi:hypothetical protein